jgi:hypothetical protein
LNNIQILFLGLKEGSDPMVEKQKLEQSNATIMLILMQSLFVELFLNVWQTEGMFY